MNDQPFVLEEIERLEEKTDEEIMQIFANQMMGAFPSMVIVNALGKVMKHRKLVPTELKLYLEYKNFNGEKREVHFASNPNFYIY